MGKKYLPVTTAGTTRKVYLDDLLKIHRTFKRILKPIPAYPSISILRKPTH